MGYYLYEEERFKITIETEYPRNIAKTLWAACAVCTQPEMDWLYNPRTEDSSWAVIHRVLDAGHWSIAEHISISFLIRGISRACANQLTRHRHCSFSQLSQRNTVLGDKIDARNVTDWLDSCMTTNFEDEKAVARLHELLSPFFQLDGLKPDELSALAFIFTDYHDAIEKGMSAENARALLPMCTRTNIMMTCNLRQLVHMANLRLCNKSQDEIRALFKLISEIVEFGIPQFGKYLVPKCHRDGRCTEINPCGNPPAKREEGERQ